MLTFKPARLAALVALLLLAGGASADPLRTGFDAFELGPNDDNSSAATPLGFQANFFGNLHDEVIVNNNGNVTFAAPLSAFTPFDLTSTDRQIIAPFFADVDTTALGRVTYGTGTVDGRAAFAATWDGVGYYDAQSDKQNTFQAVLIDRSDVAPGDFDIEFNYGSIQWETGDFSGGIAGLGGSSARVGYSNGSGDVGTFFELEGSAVNGAFVDGGSVSLEVWQQDGQPEGRIVFQARNGGIFEPPPSVPEPTTLALAGVGLAGFAARRLRRRR